MHYPLFLAKSHSLLSSAFNLCGTPLEPIPRFFAACPYEIFSTSSKLGRIGSSFVEEDKVQVFNVNDLVFKHNLELIKDNLLKHNIEGVNSNNNNKTIDDKNNKDILQ